MMIFDVLTAKQQAIADLFCRTQEAIAAGRIETARDAFAELSVQLLGMMRAEHTVVYPTFVYSAGLADEVAEAVRDHREIERAINHIRLAPLALEGWIDAVARLHNRVIEHIDLEELTMFPLARLRLTDDEMRRLAHDFLAREPVTTALAGASITYELPTAA